MLVDSHTHLYLSEFEDGGSTAVERAIRAGVEHMMFPNVDLSTIEPMKSLKACFPLNIDMAIGLHPTEVSSNWAEDIEIIEREARTGDYKAIGEIGIDLYWDKTYREEQLIAFERQCLLAVNLSLPIIIHCRDGLDDALGVLNRLERKPKGVFHSFGGTVDDVQRIRECGDFYFGINGILTFKNSKLREVIPSIPIDRLLLETDSPYLAPVPMRGKRNESAYLVHTAGYLASVLGCSTGDVEAITTQNYFNLFGK